MMIRRVVSYMAMIIAVIIAMYFVNFAAKYMTAVLFTSGLSNSVWNSGEASGQFVPDVAHSIRYMTNTSPVSRLGRVQSPSFSGVHEMVNLSPQPGTLNQRRSIVSFLQDPLYWKCSPERYVWGYVFILFAMSIWRRRMSLRTQIQSSVWKLIAIGSVFHIGGVGFIYPAIRLFWSGVQASLMQTHMSDARGIDSTRVLWMSWEIHLVLYAGLIVGLAWLAIVCWLKFCIASPEQNPENTTDSKPSVPRLLAYFVGVGVVLYCVCAPITMPLTIGLMIR